MADLTELRQKMALAAKALEDAENDLIVARQMFLEAAGWESAFVGAAAEPHWRKRLPDGVTLLTTAELAVEEEVKASGRDLFTVFERGGKFGLERAGRVFLRAVVPSRSVADRLAEVGPEYLARLPIWGEVRDWLRGQGFRDEDMGPERAWENEE